TVLAPRGREYFDGMNVHNPYIRYYNGKYYLYYMGTTYGGPIPQHMSEIDPYRSLETWNRKRIGLAVAESVYGPWVRRDTPLLEPRDPSHWASSVISTPAVAILPDGESYLLPYSSSYAGATLQIGLAVADKPDGPFERACENPIFDFEDPNLHLEDPYLWYEDGKFRLLIKDDCKNGSSGIGGEWGAGLYAESDDCVHFTFADQPKAYSRTVTWDDGSVTRQCNLERPFLLLEDGHPTHLYLATGNGDVPYGFDRTYNIVMPLKKEK
ncbi:MAG: glycoside hydrolase family protein, partial [Clostridia bacterium]|nr:glycoside hydrolase family protein [Clostridia bacterium]